MKLRRAAALALVGWFLLISPVGKQDAALSQWQIVKSFDRADACEEYRSQGVAGGRWNLTPPFGAVAVAKLPFSLCIASDDPRLKPN